MRGYILGLCACVAWQPLAYAQQGSSNMVRQAAIERLQSKLGTLRGTLKPDAERVFLTEEMIEQLKPIKVSARAPLQELQPSDTGSNFVTAAGGEKIAMSEINALAGLTVSESASGYDLGTTAGVEEQGARIDDMIKLADEIAAGN